MRITKKTYHACYYQIEGCNEWVVVGKRLHGIGRACFDVYKNDELQYTLKQPSLVASIIAKAPFIMFVYESPFFFYRCGVKCGNWKPIIHPALHPGKWEFFFDGVIYQVASGPYVSFREAFGGDNLHIQKDTLFMNGEMMATYVRNANADGYSIECYLAESAIRLDILLLFGAFIENYLDRDR